MYIYITNLGVYLFVRYYLTIKHLQVTYNSTTFYPVEVISIALSVRGQIHPANESIQGICLQILNYGQTFIFIPSSILYSCKAPINLYRTISIVTQTQTTCNNSKDSNFLKNLAC